MGGGEARQQRGREAAAAAARRPGEGEARREALAGKARAGKAASGAGERATKKRRKVNHGMFRVPPFLAVMLSWRCVSSLPVVVAVVVAAGLPRCYTMRPLGFFLTVAFRLSPALLALAGEMAVGASPHVCTYSGRSLEVSDSGRGGPDGVSPIRGISQLRENTPASEPPNMRLSSRC